MAAKRRDDAMTSVTVAGAWDWLLRELDHWSESGRCADFWWRDDDAIDTSIQLDRLLQLSTRQNAPLALAVIPAQLKPALAGALQAHTRVSVLQHGYNHQSHAARGERKLEQGGTRGDDDILSDLRQGQEILRQQFGARFSAVLVPPWNRIDHPLCRRCRKSASPASQPCGSVRMPGRQPACGRSTRTSTRSTGVLGVAS